MLLFLLLLCVCAGYSNGYIASRVMTRNSRLVLQAEPIVPEVVDSPPASGKALDAPLDTGDFDISVFKKVEDVTDSIGKYVVEASIPSSDMNTFLGEYKEEMKRRKVSFPGFRAGNLPPHVMGDVRRYLVCFGLETMLGQICNANGLRFCDTKGNDVPFGEDAYYQEIIQKDFRDYDFVKQRDSWREGTDLKFSAMFYAEKDKV